MRLLNVSLCVLSCSSQGKCYFELSSSRKVHWREMDRSVRIIHFLGEDPLFNHKIDCIL